MRKPSSYYCLYAFMLLLWMSMFASCKKEHSCEGCNVPPVTSPQPADTTPVTPPDTSFTPPLLPACALCIENSNPMPQSWNFKTGNTYLCGNITEASFIGDKTTLTFFGPSACSPDTGLRMTIYLPEPLDGDKYNITTNVVAFYYYDDKVSKTILVSGASQAFYVTISSFAESTQTVSGIYHGTVFTSDGSTAGISSGRFTAKLQ